jgi:hypothetical protein
VRAQWVFYAGQSIAIVGMLAGGVAALLSRSNDVEPTGPTDAAPALVHLVQRGGAVLRRLRNLVAIGGLLLLPFGLLAWRGVTSTAPVGAPLGPPGWESWIRAASGTALACMIVLWLVACWRLHRSARRWETLNARSPLEP